MPPPAGRALRRTSLKVNATLEANLNPFMHLTHDEFLRAVHGQGPRGGPPNTRSAPGGGRQVKDPELAPRPSLEEGRRMPKASSVAKGFQALHKNARFL